MDDFLNGAEIDDIRLIDLKDGSVQSGWGPEHKSYLIIFFPKAFTPVCKSELGAINQWQEEFNKLGIEIIAGSIDHEEDILNWFDTDETLRGSTYKLVRSEKLPDALDLIRFDGSLKRASVFFTIDKNDQYELVSMEHFNKVGRSMEELHRMAWGWSTGEYCTQGWNSPADGFLKK